MSTKQPSNTGIAAVKEAADTQRRSFCFGGAWAEPAEKEHYEALLQAIETIRRWRAALKTIIDVIEAVDNRCMAADGPVSKTQDEITDTEIRQIHSAAKEALGK